MRKVLFGVLAAPAFLVTSGAHATLIGTLTHEQPTGTIGQTDSFFDVLRFTLGVGSDPLVTAADGTITSNTVVGGVNMIGGYVSSSESTLGPGSVFFTASVGPGGDFQHSFFPQFFNLDLVNPGDSFTFVNSFYTPVGITPPGTYTEDFAALTVCAPFGPNCTEVTRTADAFSRTVVPEPGTLSLFAVGLGSLVTASRRRRA